MSAKRLDLIDSEMVGNQLLSLAVTIGEDWRLDLQLIEPDAATPTDLTGWTFRSEIRNTAGTLIATMTVSIVSAALGTFAAVLAKAVTDALTAGTYSYDLWRIDDGSKYSPLLYGSVLVKPSVTDV